MPDNPISPQQEKKPEENDVEDAPTKEHLIAKLRDRERALSIDELSEILTTTVRHDKANKVIHFLGYLLTYTLEDQINIGNMAESSTGKSYIPLEIAWYFPSQDIIEYSYVSPTAFYHEYGTPIIDPNDRRDVPEEKKHKINRIDLENKILIFLDQPHDMLLQRLRPLLSHDRKVLVSHITNRRETSGLRTEVVQIVGYPTVVFCTAKFSMEDQERTRLLLLSPDSGQDKLKDSILLKLEKESDREAFRKCMESEPQRVWLAQRVTAIRTEHISQVIIPEELRPVIAEHFFEMHKFLKPRNQRDLSRLLALIKGHALLNLWQRDRIADAEKRGDSIVVNNQDVVEGFALYEEISVANELGLPPEVYDVYNQMLSQIPENGMTKKDFSRTYFNLFHRTIGKKRVEEILGLWQSVGLFTEEDDAVDHRVKRYVPTPQGVFISENTTDGSARLSDFNEINTPRPVGNTTSENSKVENSLKTPKVQPIPEGRKCGDCANWHKPGCGHPDAEPSAITPLNTFAAECRCFIDKKNLLEDKGEG